MPDAIGRVISAPVRKTVDVSVAVDTIYRTFHLHEVFDEVVDEANDDAVDKVVDGVIDSSVWEAPVVGSDVDGKDEVCVRNNKGGWSLSTDGLDTDVDDVVVIEKEVDVDCEEMVPVSFVDDGVVYVLVDEVAESHALVSGGVLVGAPVDGGELVGALIDGEVKLSSMVCRRSGAKEDFLKACETLIGVVDGSVEDF
ncbi:hypothetical protein NDU88_000521 [Pleurodeles waltl]|uniref:Uncharacterized protein n=1 Tax=Pleurodeles waltl TaxID=8319 RepID=A0AAV7U7S2_PLEWA|nr:hypothetical protein NDU88_000521 [Pleurodeles waltl]